MTKYLLKAKNHIVDLFGLVFDKKDTVILGCLPKSGSTYLRFLIFNYLRIHENKDLTPSFSNLDKYMPAFGRGNIGKFPFTTFPRVIKTHKPNLLGMFDNNKVIFLSRTYKKQLPSYFQYLTSLKVAPWSNSFEDFIKSKKGINGLINFNNSYAGHKNILREDFDNLLENPFDALKSIFHFIKVEFDEDIAHLAIEASSSDKVSSYQKLEQQKGIKVVENYDFANLKKEKPKFTEELLNYCENIITLPK